MRKVKDQSNLNILSGSDELTQISNEAEQVSKNEGMDLSKIIESQKSQKLSSKDDGLKSGHSVMSATGGNISNLGGSSKFTGVTSTNSIWGEQKEAVKKEEKIESEFKIDREALEKLGKENQPSKVMISNKTTIVSPQPPKSNYNSPKENLSIFDNENFQRLAEATSGEKLSKDKKERDSQKDESWKNNRVTSTKEITNNFFNNLMNNGKK